uniref:Protein SPEC3-like n=1 Tax=Saccoglossus kowalevskii TaxID=10224 RepID=A0ABM0LY62_SACKO|nr:PREDICTED: protein SPEC3-like [Saccoglossus kowalevskii]
MSVLPPLFPYSQAPPPQGYHLPPQQGYYLPPPQQGYYLPPPQQGYYPPPPQQGYYPPPPPQEQMMMMSNNTVVVAGAAPAPQKIIQTQLRQGVNHCLHCVITFFFFPWVIVWIILNYGAHKNSKTYFQRSLSYKATVKRSET